MDEASSIISSLNCPNCSTSIGVASSTTSGSSSPGSPRADIYVQYTNEGGVQDKLNIFDPIREEAYTQAHPEAVPARAFHLMCSEGDVDGIVELLMQVGDQVPDIGEMIRYRDPLSGMTSGLHLAVTNMHEGVIWLLLWLSSSVPTSDFPAEARDSAESMSLGRLDIQPDHDIRLLKDEQGRTAEATARGLDGPLLRLVESGILAP